MTGPITLGGLIKHRALVEDHYFFGGRRGLRRAVAAGLRGHPGTPERWRQMSSASLPQQKSSLTVDASPGTSS
jgi:hypothetical protein